MNMTINKALKLAIESSYMRCQGGQWIVCEKVTRESQGQIESYWQESHARFYHAARDAMTRARALKALELIGYPRESILGACDEGGPLRARVLEYLARYPLPVALAQFGTEGAQ